MEKFFSYLRCELAHVIKYPILLILRVGTLSGVQDRIKLRSACHRPPDRVIHESPIEAGPSRRRESFVLHGHVSRMLRLTIFYAHNDNSIYLREEEWNGTERP